MITFKDFVEYMVDTYGVSSYLNNEDDVESDNFWVTCPECDDIILEEDWNVSEIVKEGHFICPICGYEEEE